MAVTSLRDLASWTFLGALSATLLGACGGSATSGAASTSSGGSDKGSGGGANGGGGATGGGDNGTWSPEERCTNPRELAGGFIQCDEGYRHRPRVEVCPDATPRQEPVGAPGSCTWDGCCESDTDCTGALQYCSFAPPAGNLCITGCLQDSDCGAGQICECGDPMGRCVSADCTSDADCPGSLTCASWATNDGCGPYVTYTCQTADDRCDGNSCGDGRECSQASGTRQCQDQERLCVIGRPFLVQGAARVAPTRPTHTWLRELHLGAASDLARAVEGLGQPERAQLTAHYLKTAQLEHASVAAFARFALELLSLGAPSELLELTQQAMADETRHAQLCFQLATTFSGGPLGPGALDLSDALSQVSAQQIVVNAIVEGCIGETLASLEAAEAAALCEEPTVRAVLQTIAHDEARHAELAWKFLRWALAQRPELRAVARATFAAYPAPSPRDRSDVGLEAWGVLSEARSAQVRRAGLTAVVGPCCEALLEAPAEAPWGAGRTALAVDLTPPV